MQRIIPYKKKYQQPKAKIAKKNCMKFAQLVLLIITRIQQVQFFKKTNANVAVKAQTTFVFVSKKSEAASLPLNKQNWNKMANKNQVIELLAVELQEDFADVFVLADGGKYSTFESKTVAGKIIDYFLNVKRETFLGCNTGAEYSAFIKLQLRFIETSASHYWALLLYLMDEDKQLDLKDINPMINEITECGTELKNCDTFFIQFVKNLKDEYIRFVCDENQHQIKTHLAQDNDPYAYMLSGGKTQYIYKYNLHTEKENNLAVTTLKKLFKNKLLQ